MVGDGSDWIGEHADCPSVSPSCRWPMIGRRRSAPVYRVYDEDAFLAGEDFGFGDDLGAPDLGTEPVALGGEGPVDTGSVSSPPEPVASRATSAASLRRGLAVGAVLAASAVVVASVAGGGPGRRATVARLAQARGDSGMAMPASAESSSGSLAVRLARRSGRSLTPSARLPTPAPAQRRRPPTASRPAARRHPRTASPHDVGGASRLPSSPASGTAVSSAPDLAVSRVAAPRSVPAQESVPRAPVGVDTASPRPSMRSGVHTGEFAFER